MAKRGNAFAEAQTRIEADRPAQINPAFVELELLAVHARLDRKDKEIATTGLIELLVAAGRGFVRQLNGRVGIVSDAADSYSHRCWALIVL